MNLGGIKVHFDSIFQVKSLGFRNHRLSPFDVQISSIEIERVCNGVDESILETAAFGLPPSGGGPEQLVIAAVFKDRTLPSQINMDQLKQAFNSALQKKLNPLFKVNINISPRDFLTIHR